MKGMDLEISFLYALEGFLFLPKADQIWYMVKNFFSAIVMKGKDLKTSFWQALEGFLFWPKVAENILCS